MNAGQERLITETINRNDGPVEVSVKPNAYGPHPWRLKVSSGGDFAFFSCKNEDELNEMLQHVTSFQVNYPDRKFTFLSFEGNSAHDY